jgi:hypothetical protein
MNFLEKDRTTIDFDEKLDGKSKKGKTMYTGFKDMEKC